MKSLTTFDSLLHFRPDHLDSSSKVLIMGDASDIGPEAKLPVVVEFS